MYNKNSKNYVTFFTADKENTDKVIYGRISEAIKTGDKAEDGKDIYEYESWNARFVGKAFEKAKDLKDKDTVILTEWNCRNPYNKETKQSYPYILVTDFDIKEK